MRRFWVAAPWLALALFAWAHQADQARSLEARLQAQSEELRQARLEVERLRAAVDRLSQSRHTARSLWATVTAYTPYAESTGKAPGHPQFNRVAWRGYRGAPGTCAADTDYYPFGTVLRVEGLGFCVVADRGGAIRGPHRIDWYVAGPESVAVRLAREWGKREVWVEVLRHER